MIQFFFFNSFASIIFFAVFIYIVVKIFSTKRVSINQNNIFDHQIEELVLVEKIFSIKELENLTSLPYQQIILIIKNLINKGNLKGYTINYSNLMIEKSVITNIKDIVNQKLNRTSPPHNEIKCKYCGSVQNGDNNRCDNCGANLK